LTSDSFLPFSPSPWVFFFCVYALLVSSLIFGSCFFQSPPLLCSCFQCSFPCFLLGSPSFQSNSLLVSVQFVPSFQSKSVLSFQSKSPHHVHGLSLAFIAREQNRFFKPSIVIIAGVMAMHRWTSVFLV
jgi:hypothetical protein